MDYYLRLAITFAIVPIFTVCLIWLGSVIKVFLINKLPNGLFKRIIFTELWTSASSNSHRRITKGRTFR